MKYNFKFQKTALHIAVENENTDIVQILLSKPNINVNLYAINTLLFIKF